MKSRASLLLVEQLVMTLVFALAAAVCLSCFVKADAISRDSRQKAQAAVLARNAAEQIKAGQQPEEIQGDYRVETEKLEGEIPGLGKVRIVVYLEGQPLFSLTAACQEELP